MSKRNPAVLGRWGPGGTRVVAAESMWREPLAWDREAKAAGERRRVFCASLADVFEAWDGPVKTAKVETLYRVDLDRKTNARYLWPGSGGGVAWEASPEFKVGKDRRMLTMDDVRERLFDLIGDTPNLDWLLLTKRPENMESMLPWTSTHAGEYRDRYWPNVWLGTTVEDRDAKARIDVLRSLPAAVRFLSMEPLIEDPGELDLTGIHWVIVGGESGPAARPCDLAWIRAVVRQCGEAGVPCFVKQLGARPYDIKGAKDFSEAHRLMTTDEARSEAGRHTLARTLELMTVRLNDPHGADPAEWPEDLRVREMPTTAGRVA